MPDRPHHTDKWRSCVEQIVAKGQDESSAAALCTKSLQDADEPIFEGAEAHSEEEIRLLEETGVHMLRLHLLGATEKARTELIGGREYLVVPVVALMEGVIHAVNAETPEFVSADVLRKAASTWVSQPTCVGHPKKNGRHCSANSPDVLEAHSFGKIRSVVMKGTKMLMETLVDPLRLKILKQERLLSDLREGKPVEVSVGAVVLSTKEKGEWNGKPFVGKWVSAAGDHIAFLPGGRGACSLEMGCGAHRSAQHFVTAESIDVVEPARPPIMVVTTLDEKTLDERMRAVYGAVESEWNSPPEPMAYPIQIFDDYVIIRKGDDTFSVPYVEKSDGSVSLGKATKVKQTWVAAASKMMDCPTCNGTGQVSIDGEKGKDKQQDCSTCDGSGKVMRMAEMKALLGARHSKMDGGLIQGVHDHAVALGAKCYEAPKALENAPCGCGTKPTAAAVHSAETIRNEGGRWMLYSKDGSRRLGIHNTKEEAVAQRTRIDARVKQQQQQQTATT